MMTFAIGIVYFVVVLVACYFAYAITVVFPGRLIARLGYKYLDPSAMNPKQYGEQYAHRNATWGWPLTLFKLISNACDPIGYRIASAIDWFTFKVAGC